MINKDVIPNEVNVAIKHIWPMLLLFVIVLFLIRIFDAIFNKKKLIIYKDIYMLYFILYLFLLFELVTSTDYESYSNNFIPFKEITRYNLFSKLFFKNVIGNVLLFIPFGYFISNYLKSKKIYIPVLISLITSISIEVIQMYIGRSFDIDDIILNLCGGIIGYILYKIIDKFKNILPSFLKKEWIINLLLIIILIVSILLCLDYYNILEVL